MTFADTFLLAVQIFILVIGPVFSIADYLLLSGSMG